jgi:hypothetical protein
MRVVTPIFFFSLLGCAGQPSSRGHGETVAVAKQDAPHVPQIPSLADAGLSRIDPQSPRAITYVY